MPAWKGDHGYLDGPTDTPLGLTHLGAREYDPVLGRFLSVDPLMAAFTPQTLNAYAYANNSPATFTDPDGLALFEGSKRGGTGRIATPKPGGGYKITGSKPTPPKPPVKKPPKPTPPVKKPTAGEPTTHKVIKDAADVSDTLSLGYIFMKKANKAYSSTYTVVDLGDSLSERALAEQQKEVAKKYGLNSVSNVFNNPVVQNVGRFAGPLDAGLDYLDARQDGLGVADAWTKTGIKAGVSSAFVAGGAAAGGICLGAAVICSPAFALAGGWAGDRLGGFLGDVVVDLTPW